jgi:hypothetical protein
LASHTHDIQTINNPEFLSLILNHREKGMPAINGSESVFVDAKKVLPNVFQKNGVIAMISALLSRFAIVLLL